MMPCMSSLKVPVGVTSVAGYGVTAASVITAALDYIGGDHTQPTKTTLYLGVVAGVSFLTTQIGRYLQATAQAKAPKPAPAQIPSVWSKGSAGTTGNVQTASPGHPQLSQQVQSISGEVRTLTDAELEDDPDMGEPLDATAESYVGDPKDKHGAEDHPV